MIKLDYNYWDCECPKNYIQLNEKAYCSVCQAYREEQPLSRAEEVKNMNEIKKVTVKEMIGLLKDQRLLQMIIDTTQFDDLKKLAKIRLNNLNGRQ